MKLSGRSAIVTGGASGIGRATAIALAAEGCAVMVTDIDDHGSEQTLALIGKAGGKISCRHHDVADEAAWIQVVADTVAAHGGLDILVNNAGIGSGQLVTEMSLESWNRQVAINLTGVFLGTKHAIPAMRKGGKGGSIINISSVAGLEGSAGLAGYCATKGGVRLFTKAVAKEYAADRIRCNSVHPGIIDTPIWTKIDEGGLPQFEQLHDPGANTLSADMIAAAGAPLGFAGLPQDIANGILFLASDESRYMTGSELVIDGGWTA
ncbi:MAG: SDR family oxidoreductase [Sandarakinorhabdus sp.]|nr:SDR family oxidoreductase [Sandarakinorhabdus sp.]MBS3962670.1 SDR family oxidoreductase [Sandarakinorhabdus sp.]